MKKILSLLSALAITTGVATSVSACEGSGYNDETAFLELASWDNSGRNINLVFDHPNPKYSASDFKVTYYDINGHYQTIGVSSYSKSVLRTSEDLPSYANFDKMFVTCLKNHSMVQIDGSKLEENMITQFSIDPDSKNESDGLNAFDVGIKFLNNVPKLKAKDFKIQVTKNNKQTLYSNGKNYTLSYDTSIKKCKITINDPKFCMEKITSAVIKYKDQSGVSISGRNPAFLDIVNNHQDQKLEHQNDGYSESYNLTKSTYDHINNWDEFLKKYRYFYYDFNREAFNPEASWYDYVDSSGQVAPGKLSSAVDLTTLKKTDNRGYISYETTMGMGTKDQAYCELWINSYVDTTGELFMWVHVTLKGNPADYGNSYYQIHLHGDARFTNYKI